MTDEYRNRIEFPGPHLLGGIQIGTVRETVVANQLLSLFPPSSKFVDTDAVQQGQKGLPFWSRNTLAITQFVEHTRWCRVLLEHATAELFRN